MEYQARPLQQKDLPEILALVKIAFQIEPHTATYIWKYFENAFGPGYLSGIYKNGEAELAAFGALIPEEMYIYGEKRQVHKYTDFMVHPNHRRKGLSRVIIQSLLDRIEIRGEKDIVYALGSKIVTKGFIRLNFVKLSEVYNHFKPSLLIKLRQTFSLNRKKEYDKIEKLDKIPVDFSTFSFQKKAAKITTVKSVDYLKWRIRNPRFQYSVLVYREAQEILGYLIYSEGDTPFLNIVDFEVKNANTKVLKALFAYAEDEALKKAYKGVLGLTINNSGWATILRKYGYLTNKFEKGPLKSILDLTAFKAEDESVLVSDNWEINSLHYDDI